jgi:hypothetical protein
MQRRPDLPLSAGRIRAGKREVDAREVSRRDRSYALQASKPGRRFGYGWGVLLKG